MCVKLSVRKSLTTFSSVIIFLPCVFGIHLPLKAIIGKLFFTQYNVLHIILNLNSKACWIHFVSLSMFSFWILGFMLALFTGDSRCTEYINSLMGFH